VKVRETAETETPASFATSLAVGRRSASDFFFAIAIPGAIQRKR
jgi:hypothetical protein